MFSIQKWFQVYLFWATIVYPFHWAASDTCARTWCTPRRHARRRFAALVADSLLRRSSTAAAIVSMNRTRFERRENWIRIINKTSHSEAGGQLSPVRTRLKRFMMHLFHSVNRCKGELTLCHNLDKPNAGHGCRANRTAYNATVDATHSPSPLPPPLAPRWNQLIEIGIN